MGVVRSSVVLCVCSAFAQLSVASSAATLSSESFNKATTGHGIEPDKWASIWIIKRHIAQQSSLSLVAPQTPAPATGFSFDLPRASLQRSKSQSIYNQLKAGLSHTSSQLDYIDEIIHDLEVNIWERPTNPHAPWFETMFRRLQARYNRDQVPVDCYLAFFDGVAELSVREDVTAKIYEQELSLSELCPGLNADGIEYSNTNPAAIRQIGQLDVLREVGLGKKIVFVDTRENDEFTEVHLPGAVVLRLRDVSAATSEQFKDVDLVVPYCVKDFRGYEVAKALKRHGITRVATLSPNGLKGWLASDLPTVQPAGYNEQQAHDQLMLCAMEPMKCLNSTDAGLR